LLLPAIFPFILIFAFHDALTVWLKCQTPIVSGIIFSILWLARKWKPQTCAAFAVALTLLGFFVTVAEVPKFETNFRRNQTLKPLGLALRENYHAGDAVVCWDRLPEGLPFYSGGVISATNRPFFGGMDLTQVPFEFPGNRERLGELYLPDQAALQNLLESNRRILIVAPSGTFEKILQLDSAAQFRLIARVGQWELFSNR
jgi:hypothetical protein